MSGMRVGRIRGPGSSRDVIPVQTDVKHSNWNFNTLEPIHESGNPVRDWDSPSMHADEYYTFNAAVALHYFVSDPNQGAPNFIVSEYPASVYGFAFRQIKTSCRADKRYEMRG